MSEYKCKNNYLFKVPNTPEGKAWLEQAKLYLNKDYYQVRARGRNPKADAPRSIVSGYGNTFQAFTPLQYAQNLVIYLSAKLVGRKDKYTNRQLTYPIAAEDFQDKRAGW